MLRDFAQDLRIAARSFAARPLFALVAAITVALAIGASTVVFGVVRGLVLRPLPYADPSRLVSIWPDQFLSYREVLFLREHANSYVDIAAFVPGWSMTLTESGDPAKLAGARVTANLPGVLGVVPAAGRTFVAEEETPGADDAVILSGRMWHGRFAGNPTVIGQRLMLDGVPHAVVGAMPIAFEIYQPETEVWRVLAFDRDEWYYEGNGLLAVGRLRPGVSVADAHAEVRILAERMRETFGFPDDYATGAAVIPLRDWLVGPLRPMLLVALGAVGFVLLLAGANLANLLVARAMGRTHEIAVRAALGASRGRLVRHLLAESALLAGLGGAGGVVLAYWGIGVATRLLPAGTPFARGVGIDLPVLVTSIALAIGTGILFGLVPALSAVRIGAPDALRGARGSAAGRAGRRTRATLVGAEVALGTVLLVGAALMLQTLWRLNRVDPGFRAEGVLTLQTQPTSRSGEERQAYYASVFERLAGLPEVSAVGAIQHLPLTGSGWASDIEVAGRPLAAGERPPRVGWRVVGGDYFGAMGIRRIAGRLFGRDDRDGTTPVMLVNESMARQLWPDASAVGERVRAGNATGGEWATVIGVIGDVHHEGLDRDPVPEMYRPLTQYPHGGMTLVVRTAGEPYRSARAVIEAIWSIDRNVPISEVRSLPDVASASVGQPRTMLVLLGVFAFVGLVLGAVGTYGVVAYHVISRTREIGIRIALGATPGSVVAGSLREGLRLAVLGAAAGLALALLLGRALEAFVFDVRTTDPLTLGAVAATLVVVTAVASWVPARRAARVDPMQALREE